MDSPVDVGGFAEPRKTLSQCALPSVEQLSVHPRFAHGGARIPNNLDICLSVLEDICPQRVDSFFFSK